MSVVASAAARALAIVRCDRMVFSRKLYRIMAEEGFSRVATKKALERLSGRELRADRHFTGATFWRPAPRPRDAREGVEGGV